MKIEKLAMGVASQHPDLDEDDADTMSQPEGRFYVVSKRYSVRAASNLVRLGARTKLSGFPVYQALEKITCIKRIPSVRQLNLGLQDLVVVASRKIMGTTKEWREVLFAAILWGGGMLLFRRMEGKIPKDVVLIYALLGLLFGLVTRFPLKRVFSFPLIFIPLGIIVVVLLVKQHNLRTRK